MEVGSLSIGEAGLQLLRYGAGEARISGALRTDGIVRALGGVYAGSFTSAQRNALVNPPYGLLVTNSETNELEMNYGTPAAPVWDSIGVNPPFTTADLADGAVTTPKLASLLTGTLNLTALNTSSWADLAKIQVGKGADLDISSAVITVTNSLHELTSSGAHNLTTIDGNADGMLLFLLNRTGVNVTYDATSNILTAGNLAANHVLGLLYAGAIAKWVVICNI